MGSSLKLGSLFRVLQGIYKACYKGSFEGTMIYEGTIRVVVP